MKIFPIHILSVRVRQQGPVVCCRRCSEWGCHKYCCRPCDYGSTVSAQLAMQRHCCCCCFCCNYRCHNEAHARRRCCLMPLLLLQMVAYAALRLLPAIICYQCWLLLPPPPLLMLLFAAHSQVIGVACCSATKSAVANFSCCRKSIKFFFFVFFLFLFLLPHCLHFIFACRQMSPIAFFQQHTYIQTQIHVRRIVFERVASTCRNLTICTGICVHRSLIYGSHMIYWDSPQSSLYIHLCVYVCVCVCLPVLV